MEVRRAGQHARQTTRQMAARYLGYVAALLVAGAVALAAFGFASLGFAVTELAVIAALLAIDRFGVRAVDRWARGARGEEEIGRLLEGVGDGWFSLHDINTGRGNIDHVVIGPAGLFTIETKSHRGRICVDRIAPGMLKQAYAQRKWLERISGHDVEAFLVFSAAYLDRPVSRRRGVVILPGRMLARHLTSRDLVLRPQEVAAIHSRLEQATAG
jgi:hypothetical protein